GSGPISPAAIAADGRQHGGGGPGRVCVLGRSAGQWAAAGRLPGHRAARRAGGALAVAAHPRARENTGDRTMTSDPSQAPPAPPSRWHRLVRWALWCAAGALAVVAVGFGVSWWGQRLFHSITDDAFVEAHIVNVAPEMVSGRIVRFLVEENDPVKQ